MTSVEQRKMVQKLKSIVMKMSVDERQAFEMMAKRDRDDEELDSLINDEVETTTHKVFSEALKTRSRRCLE